MRFDTLRRPGTIAAISAIGGALSLTLGLFLAVGRDLAAAEQVKTWTSDDGSQVKVIAVNGDDGEPGEKCGFLGVDVEEDTKSDDGGALVQRVVRDSPAGKAGLKEGDVIVGFDGDVIRGPAKLTEKIHGAKPGDKVTLDLRRDGKREKIAVEMGSRPEWSWSWKSEGKDLPGLGDEQAKALERSLESLEKMKIMTRAGKIGVHGPLGHGMWIVGGQKPLLGIEMVETTPELREAMGGRKDAGVLIGRVLPGSAAEKAGLKVGDLVVSVDGQAVADAGDLAGMVGEREGKTIDLEIVRDKKTVRVKAAIPEVKEEDTPHGPRAGIWRVPAPPEAPEPTDVPEPPSTPVPAGMAEHV